MQELTKRKGWWMKNKSEVMKSLVQYFLPFIFTTKHPPTTCQSLVNIHHYFLHSAHCQLHGLEGKFNTSAFWLETDECWLRQKKSFSRICMRTCSFLVIQSQPFLHLLRHPHHSNYTLSRVKNLVKSIFLLLKHFWFFLIHRRVHME